MYDSLKDYNSIFDSNVKHNIGVFHTLLIINILNPPIPSTNLSPLLVWQPFSYKSKGLSREKAALPQLSVRVLAENVSSLADSPSADASLRDCCALSSQIKPRKLSSGPDFYRPKPALPVTRPDGRHNATNNHVIAFMKRTRRTTWRLTPDRQAA